uniref:Uncharacterized protein n=1 Tax=Anguilla anguilla TaxID=7936 RepID=A0A0E9U6B8_ANGAN
MKNSHRPRGVHIFLVI